MGETRLFTGSMFTDKLFTGQREIAGLGIYHYGARFYSPKLGRFLSADTIIQNLANPQLLNRYSYVNNNPLRYTDPTGHMMTADDGGGCTTCVYTPTTGTTGGGGGGTTTGGGDDWWDDDAGSDGGGGSSSTSTSGATNVNLTYFNPTINALYSTPKILPSPFACEWYDCALSLASVIFSLGTFPGMPLEIQGPAYVLDIGATVLAYFSTEDAYKRGEITDVQRKALNSTGILGAFPSPFGLGLSLLNLVFTTSGYPH